MTLNIMIAGVGGQGTVLASKLIAAAAMKKGYDVRTTETIGMAQRGGSVVSHVRIGDNIFSPLISFGQADALIAFEPAEAVRQLPYLRDQGTVIVCDIWGVRTPIESNKSEMLNYLKEMAQNIKVIDGKSLTKKNAKTMNVIMLGAAAQAGLFPFDAETLKEVIPQMIHERFVEMNINAIETGRNLTA